MAQYLWKYASEFRIKFHIDIAVLLLLGALFFRRILLTIVSIAGLKQGYVIFFF